MTDLDIDLVPDGGSPLKRPDPGLIQELFDKDPLDLSDQDLDTIILEFRMDRANYIQARDEGKKPSRAKASAKKESASPTVEISPDLLSDLGL